MTEPDASTPEIKDMQSFLGPHPVPDTDTQGYWDGLGHGELRLQQCRDCSRFQHFPSATCSSCLSFNLCFQRVSGSGRVYSFVVIHHVTNPAFVDRAPYAVAWVEVPEQPGLRVLADLVDCHPAEVQIGLPVEAVFDELEAGLTLLRFRPA